MSRPIALGLTAMLFAFTLAALPSRAPAETAAPAAAAGAEQKAPCPGMPGGGCCGSAECKGGAAAASDAAPADAKAADAGGGCPCQRARAAAAKAAAEKNP